MSFFNVINTVFRTPFALVTKVFSSPMGVFVYGIMSKWYIMIMLGSAIVAFWVLKGLTDAGVLQDAWKTVYTAMEESKAIAQHCTPKIRNLKKVWHCIDNIQAYKRSDEEKQLYKDVVGEIRKGGAAKRGNSRGEGSRRPEDDPYSDLFK